MVNDGDFPGDKAARGEVDQPLPYSAQVKNGDATPLLPYVLIA
jgi:hypothetical protein